jgi:hypothetical protein
MHDRRTCAAKNIGESSRRDFVGDAIGVFEPRARVRGEPMHREPLVLVGARYGRRRRNRRTIADPRKPKGKVADIDLRAAARVGEVAVRNVEDGGQVARFFVQAGRRDVSS